MRVMALALAWMLSVFVADSQAHLQQCELLSD
jgi:hypothetical protein